MEHDLDLSVFDGMTDAEFEALEKSINKQMAVWQIRNLKGTAVLFHDDQHIGQKRRELFALSHKGVNVEELRAFRSKAVVDSLEGNSLAHLLDTPVIEVDDTCTKARAVWWSLGLEGLSVYREKPMAILSLGMFKSAFVIENGEWKIVFDQWQRTTKNEYHAGWVHSMERTTTRPPLTAEQDRNFLGRYAYQKDTVRQPVPEPPVKNTWECYPNETDQAWTTVNI